MEALHIFINSVITLFVLLKQNCIAFCYPISHENFVFLFKINGRVVFQLSNTNQVEKHSFINDLFFIECLISGRFSY